MLDESINQEKINTNRSIDCPTRELLGTVTPHNAEQTIIQPTLDDY